MCVAEKGTELRCCLGIRGLENRVEIPEMTLGARLRVRKAGVFCDNVTLHRWFKIL